MSPITRAQPPDLFFSNSLTSCSADRDPKDGGGAVPSGTTLLFRPGHDKFGAVPTQWGEWKTSITCAAAWSQPKPHGRYPDCLPRLVLPSAKPTCAVLQQPSLVARSVAGTAWDVPTLGAQKSIAAACTPTPVSSALHSRGGGYARHCPAGEQFSDRTPLPGRSPTTCPVLEWSPTLFLRRPAGRQPLEEAQRMRPTTVSSRSRRFSTPRRVSCPPVAPGMGPGTALRE